MAPTSRIPCHKITRQEAVNFVWPRIWAGEFHSRIAADFDTNGGRISEIKTGKRHPGSEEEARAKHAP